MRSTAHLLIVVLGVLLGLTAGSSGTAAAVAQRGSIQVDGRARTYALYLPAAARPGERLPILVMLHGGMESGDKIAQETALPTHVDRGRFIAVFPDAIGPQWNDGRRPNTSSRTDIDFVAALVREVAARFGGDPSRVFLAGVSNGGMMTQRIACEAGSIFSAYAIGVANMPYALAGSCRPSRRAPMVFIASTDDRTMPWAGGEVTVGRGFSIGTVLSMPQTVEFWGRVNGCGAARVYDLPDRVNDGTRVRVHDFGSCGVILYEVQGGGHAWPGHARQPGRFARQSFGNTSYEIDATAVVIDFFRRYGL